MDKHNRELRQYFHEIKKQAHMYARSSRFADDLKNNIYSYISDNPNVSINEIHEKYGTPSELAKEFFQQVDMETYNRKTLFAKFVKRILIICFILFIAALSILFIDRQINQPTTIKYNIETNS